ncbi:MAG: hypothetical protein ACLPX5_15020 [Dissulfurispiraceae bacterium]
MLLKMNIAAWFISSAIKMAPLSAFMYVRSFNVKQELEDFANSEKIRGESLQLKRHEKNYFLDPRTRKAEANIVHKYLNEPDTILNIDQVKDDKRSIDQLRTRSKEHLQRFNKIESLIPDISEECDRAKSAFYICQDFAPLIVLALWKHPDRSHLPIFKTSQYPSSLIILFSIIPYVWASLLHVQIMKLSKRRHPGE